RCNVGPEEGTGQACLPPSPSAAESSERPPASNEASAIPVASAKLPPSDDASGALPASSSDASGALPPLEGELSTSPPPSAGDGSRSSPLSDGAFEVQLRESKSNAEAQRAWVIVVTRSIGKPSSAVARNQIVDTKPRIPPM